MRLNVNMLEIEISNVKRDIEILQSASQRLTTDLSTRCIHEAIQSLEDYKNDIEEEVIRQQKDRFYM